MFSRAISRLPETFSRNFRGSVMLEGDEGVDDVAAPVAHLHADVLEVEAQQPVVDDLHRVDEVRRDLEVDARARGSRA